MQGGASTAARRGEFGKALFYLFRGVVAGIEVVDGETVDTAEAHSLEGILVLLQDRVAAVVEGKAEPAQGVAHRFNVSTRGHGFLAWIFDRFGHQGFTDFCVDTIRLSRGHCSRSEYTA
jgi:hypothetical protein